MPRRHHYRLKLALCGFVMMLMAHALTAMDAAAAFPSAQRAEALRAVPFEKLTQSASNTIRSIAERPTLYRRLPTQAIDCDPSMFLFLVRHPEVIVSIWQKMDVSQVKTQRVGPYQLLADDKAGTQCTIDLVYGDSNTHIFVAKGSYSGSLSPRPITGSGVFILRSGYAKANADRTTVSGTLDCFIQFDNFGADLLARTMSKLIGRTADHNFTETARFISQISQAAEQNPLGLRDLATDLNDVGPPTKQKFVQTIHTVAERSEKKSSQRLAKPERFAPRR